MYVSIRWINHLVKLDKFSLPFFCESLTLAGFEI